MTRAATEKLILRRLNARIRSGKPFTVDSIWRASDEFRPGEYRSWVGRQIQLFAQANRIVPAGWAETERSMPHSRPARVWQATG